MDLEKSYDRDLIGKLWNFLNIYGVGGYLLGRINAFHWEASVCVRMDEERSESSYRSEWDNDV